MSKIVIKNYDGSEKEVIELPKHLYKQVVEFAQKLKRESVEVQND